MDTTLPSSSSETTTMIVDSTTVQNSKQVVEFESNECTSSLSCTGEQLTTITKSIITTMNTTVVPPTNLNNDEEKKKNSNCVSSKNDNDNIDTSSLTTATTTTTKQNILEKDSEETISSSPSSIPHPKKHEKRQHQPQRPSLKRARTAYFLFADERRQDLQKQYPGESVAVLAKITGQIWSNLSAEEKKSYHDKAVLERQRVAEEMKAWEETNGSVDISELATGEASASDNNALVYPIGRIRKICKLDPEVKGISKEAVLCLTKAAELFTAMIGKDCVRVAQIQNRRKLNPQDIVQVCESREKFEFLRDDIKDLTRIQQKQQQQSQQETSKAHTKPNEATSNTRSIKSYFTNVPSSKSTTNPST